MSTTKVATHITPAHKLSREEVEALWDEAETKTYFFIPGLHRLIGPIIHCLIAAGLVFAHCGIMAAWEWLKEKVESLIAEKPTQVSANKKANPSDPAQEALSGWMAFYTKWLYNPISDCWNRPIDGAAATYINVVPRRWVDDHGVKVLKAIENAPTRRCVNLGSYNYLGFGGPNEHTTPEMIECIKRNGVTVSSTPVELGISKEQMELEQAMAKYIGKEDAIVVPMGFATNSLVLPALAGRGSLIISDSLNHASIITGLRVSGATLRKCEHSDSAKMEQMLREAASEQPTWKRILVVVEGLYSMEGEICPLPEIVRLCKKYGALLYVDEAHSIGALGPHGRGVCDYWGVDPADVDILMGTFTKSFGSVGGYVSGDRKTINMLRHTALAAVYGVSMAPGCAQQVISTLNEIDSPRGAARIAQLRNNSMLLRKRLNEAGCLLLGPADSPVVPCLVKHPWKLTVFSRECLRRGVAVVIVGYPATSLLGLRTRFCVSAAFETHEVEEACTTIIEVARMVGIDFYASKPLTQEPAYTHNGEKLVYDEPAVPYRSAHFVEKEEQYPEIRVLEAAKMPRIVLSAPDYMGLANSPKAIEASIKTAEEYGCGSCGPRGFYGSTDKHLEIERRLSRWLGTEASILYSYGVVSSTSVLPPYTTKPEDIVLYDEAISLPLRFGVQLCKATTIPFPHNNVKALAAIIRSLEGKNKKKGKLASLLPESKARKFIVTEGIFMGSGDIAPLPQLVELKKRTGYMLLVDETHSVGSLGRTGRGVREHWADITGDQSLLAGDSIDLLVGSLETSLGSVGGFCCGVRKMIQHQVLSGLGYVFSASTPPYLLSAAMTAIDELEARGEPLAQTLHSNSAFVRTQCSQRLSDVYDILGDASGFQGSSPLIFLSLKYGVLSSTNEQTRLLREVCERCWTDDVAVSVAKFLPSDEGATARPALRLCASAKYSTRDYEEAIEKIGARTRMILNSWGKQKSL